MKIKSKEIVSLKRKLKTAGIKGLALDIDETLSFTIKVVVEKLMEKLGNPESLTAVEISKKYKHTNSIPYWQGDEATKILEDIIHSSEAQKDLPLIEGADKFVKEINKIIPILAYITVRPKRVIHGTRFWLKKNNFPEAPIITKPKNIHRRNGNQWKAKVLEYLYPQIVGIVDDNPGLTDFFGKKYKGVIYLYDNVETKRKDINIIPCENWEVVAKKVKECKL
ncbi:MAG TPA: hypothetical protein PKZ92_03695 [Candidatus Woesebacteria bacterium]|jgi:hypothetical protein|nr:hypothetical protein [Candidatus Shapirobacteria bacterium]HOR02331.1 hypothetical protein [Candidatus Woesebacteria bacterium]